MKKILNTLLIFVLGATCYGQLSLVPTKKTIIKNVADNIVAEEINFNNPSNVYNGIFTGGLGDSFDVSNIIAIQDMSNDVSNLQSRTNAWNDIDNKVSSAQFFTTMGSFNANIRQDFALADVVVNDALQSQITDNANNILDQVLDTELLNTSNTLVIADTTVSNAFLVADALLQADILNASNTLVIADTVVSNAFVDADALLQANIDDKQDSATAATDAELLVVSNLVAGLAVPAGAYNVSSIAVLPDPLDIGLDGYISQGIMDGENVFSWYDGSEWKYVYDTDYQNGLSNRISVLDLNMTDGDESVSNAFVAADGVLRGEIDNVELDLTQSIANQATTIRGEFAVADALLASTLDEAKEPSVKYEHVRVVNTGVVDGYVIRDGISNGRVHWEDDNISLAWTGSKWIITQKGGDWEAWENLNDTPYPQTNNWSIGDKGSPAPDLVWMTAINDAEAFEISTQISDQISDLGADKQDASTAATDVEVLSVSNALVNVSESLVNALSNELESAYTLADTTVSNAVVIGYEAGDTTLGNNLQPQIIANDDDITTLFSEVESTSNTLVGAITTASNTLDLAKEPIVKYEVVLISNTANVDIDGYSPYETEFLGHGKWTNGSMELYWTDTEWFIAEQGGAWEVWTHSTDSAYPLETGWSIGDQGSPAPTLTWMTAMHEYDVQQYDIAADAILQVQIDENRETIAGQALLEDLSIIAHDRYDFASSLWLPLDVLSSFTNDTTWGSDTTFDTDNIITYQITDPTWFAYDHANQYVNDLGELVNMSDDGNTAGISVVVPEGDLEQGNYTIAVQLIESLTPESRLKIDVYNANISGGGANGYTITTMDMQYDSFLNVTPIAGGTVASVYTGTFDDTMNGKHVTCEFTYSGTGDIVLQLAGSGTEAGTSHGVKLDNLLILRSDDLLANVDNTSDKDKPVSDAQTVEIVMPLDVFMDGYESEPAYYIDEFNTWDPIFVEFAHVTNEVSHGVWASKATWASELIDNKTIRLGAGNGGQTTGIGITLSPAQFDGAGRYKLGVNIIDYLTSDSTLQCTVNTATVGDGGANNYYRIVTSMGFDQSLPIYLAGNATRTYLFGTTYDSSTPTGRKYLSFDYDGTSDIVLQIAIRSETATSGQHVDIGDVSITKSYDTPHEQIITKLNIVDGVATNLSLDEYTFLTQNTETSNYTANVSWDADGHELFIVENTLDIDADAIEYITISESSANINGEYIRLGEPFSHYGHTSWTKIGASGNQVIHWDDILFQWVIHDYPTDEMWEHSLGDSVWPYQTGWGWGSLGSAVPTLTWTANKYNVTTDDELIATSNVLATADTALGDRVDIIESDFVRVDDSMDTWDTVDSKLDKISTDPLTLKGGDLIMQLDTGANVAKLVVSEDGGTNYLHILMWDGVIWAEKAEYFQD